MEINYPCIVQGAIALTDSLFAEEILPISISSLGCSGEEEDISECNINTGVSVSCGRYEDAGIVCQGMWLVNSILSHCYSVLFTAQDTAYDNCTTGSVRLADMLTDANASTAEGRVEVCINRAWGTVCGNAFDQDDAGTVCVIAGGFLRNG